jgi:ribonuclease R
VEIESLLVEGLVHVSSLKDDWYEFPQNNGRGKSRASTVLVGRRSGRQYSLGDRVEVQVKGVDYYRQQVDLVAVVSIENEQEGDNSAPAEISEEFELGDLDTSDEFEAE